MDRTDHVFLENQDGIKNDSVYPVQISVITPAYDESANLPLLYERLKNVFNTLALEWEWVVVDDHSDDHTFAVMETISAADKRARCLRLARNFGSHMAISCGLHHAKGACAVVLAADLQDPPELLPQLIQEWREGTQIVWAARGRREGETKSTIGFSRLYFYMMRHIIGLSDMPATGADFFLIDRQVLNTFDQFNENNTNIAALLTWMGFSQKTIFYDKDPRIHGSSGWNFGKKIKIVVDSVTAFSYLPIRAMSLVGIFIALAGFIFALVVVIRALCGNPVLGYASLMVAVLIIGGFQMLMIGVLGEYLWRALDEARRRPRYWIERKTINSKDLNCHLESSQPFSGKE